MEKQEPTALAARLASNKYPVALPNATGNFSFGASTLLELSPKLCGSSMTAKTTYWSVNKYAAYSTTAVPSQGVASLDLLSTCDSSSKTTTLSVRNLANPITMAIPTGTLPPNPAIDVSCTLGVVEVQTLNCTYSFKKTVQVGVPCDGKQTSVSFRCPSLAQCVFWNETLKAWSGKGCSTGTSADGITTCQCTHLSSFATISSTASYVSATLDSAGHLDKAYLRKNFGILVTLGVLYVVYVIAVIVVRVRRTKDSLLYLK